MTDPEREPTEEDLRGAPVLPGFELPDSVTLARGVVHAGGLQPEDVGVLGFLKLRDPRQPATKEDLAREMQALGWKMGKTRFDGIFQRLKSTGHIKHVSAYNPETGRPEWRIEFYLNPANNDQYLTSAISAFSQVRTETLETGDTQAGQPFETLETGVSQGQKESQVSGDSLPKPWKPGIPTEAVPAGQDRNAENRVFRPPPPHPPEEVTTSSPYPHTDTTGNSQVRPQKEGEEAGYAEKDLWAAADVLQRLPDPWTQGKLNAGKLAPKLLTVMAEQGWPGIHAVERRILVKQLTKNPHKVTNPYRLLASDRIPNLPRYEVVTATQEAPGGPSAGPMCPKHPKYPAGRRCVPCVMA